MVKRLLYMTNFVALLSSICSIVVGIWIAATRKKFECLVGTQLYVSVAILLVVLGGVAAASCVTLNYGTYQELRCLLYTFSVSALVLMLMLVLTGAMGFEFVDQMEASLEFEMVTSLKNLYGVEEEITDAWDHLQSEYQCCAIETNSTLDLSLWRTSKWYITKGQLQNFVLPATCCKPAQSVSGLLNSTICQQRLDPRYVYTEGCYAKLHDDLAFVSFVAAVCGTTNSLILVIPACLAVWVARLIQK